MDTDRNLLFGVLAMQADLLTPVQFAEVCSAWAARKDTPLPDLLVERGWLTPADRADVEKLLQRKLNKHAGDARASLAEVTTDQVLHSLASVSDPDVQHSLAGLPTPESAPIGSTTAYQAQGRGRYALTRLHATGGIGQVWLARDGDLGRDVALKELRPERREQPTAKARFLEEACITGQLEHPGIVPVHELVCPTDGQPFYTMRMVRGRTLGEAIKDYNKKRQAGQAGPLDLRGLLGAFVAVCHAVDYAHSRGVLHRDLKPGNVVLGDYGEVVVLDWGLAKLLNRNAQATDEATSLPPVSLEAGSHDQTVQGQALGTPAYMAPEQAEGRIDLLGTATDVYGLGAVLYEILTGQAPFSGPGDEVLRRVAREEPDPPRQRVARVSRGLEAVCLRALAKKPAERYSSAGGLAREVERWLADEPVSAYREPLPRRVARWARRNRTLVTGAAVAVLAALAGLGAVAAVQTSANAELRRANEKVGEANAELEAANERERRRFDLAVEAIKVFHGDVSEDLLLKEKRFSGLRTKLLRGAADFYRKLEAQLRDSEDPKSRAALAQAYHELGWLIWKIGSKAEALELLRKGLAVRRELAAGDGAEEKARLQVAESLIAIGTLQEVTGDMNGARVAYEEARKLAEGPAGPEAASEAARETLGKCNQYLGDALSRLGRPDESLEAYKRSRALYQGLADAHPNDRGHKRTLGYCLDRFGAQLDSMGKSGEAMAALEQALKIHEALAAAHRADPIYQNHLASTLTQIGVAYGRRRNPAESLAAYRRAEAILEPLTEAYPAITLFQVGHGLVLNNIGFALSAMGKQPESLASHEKALVVNQRLADADPGDVQFQSDVGWTHFNIGIRLAGMGQPSKALASHGKALAVFRRLVQIDSNDALLRQRLVAVHMNIGYAKVLADRPVEALEAYEQGLEVVQKLARAHPGVPQYQKELETFKGVLAWGPAQAERLAEAGRLAEAATMYGRMVVHTPGDPQVHFKLGLVLYRQGNLAGAEESFRKAIDLAPKDPEAASHLCRVKRLAPLQSRLPALVEKKYQPGDNGERLDLAVLCRLKGFPRASTRMYADAFLADAKLADDLTAAHRYDAACAAARAAGGQGEDVAKLEDGERARLRRQALAWLLADLTLWKKQLHYGMPADRAGAKAALRQWQKDPDLGSVRDPAALAKLPEAERLQWQNLWQEVKALAEKVK